MQNLSRHSTTLNMMATLMCLFLLLLNLTTALPNPAPVADADTELNTRQFFVRCLCEWTEVDFEGDTDEECCNRPCCPINSELLRSRLRSANATWQGNVQLWSSIDDGCGGNRIVIKSNRGSSNLPEGAKYYFMGPEKLF